MLLLTGRRLPERRDSLVDTEPSIEQIADEIGIPLRALLSSQSSLRTLESSLQPAACTARQPVRRSLRQHNHYVASGYVCECRHLKAMCFPTPTAAAMRGSKPVDFDTITQHFSINSPLFAAEDEPYQVTRHQNISSNRWAPYPKPFPSPPRTLQCDRDLAYTSSRPSPVVVVRRSARLTEHYVQSGYVCECPHMRLVRQM
jgi:hypothetical protein